MGVQGAVDADAPIATFHEQPCSACAGTRLQPFPRAMTFQGMTLPKFSMQSVDSALKVVDVWLEQLNDADRMSTDEPTLADGSLRQEARLVAARTLPDVRSRLKCLSDIGIGDLTLNRPARTLSGGEFQRARLAASLSSQLYGAHFVLDEPTAGLHPRDTQRLLRALFEMRDAGGTVIVVEHDGDIMRVLFRRLTKPRINYFISLLSV